MRWWQFASVPACALAFLEACDGLSRDPSMVADASTTAAELDGGAYDPGAASEKDSERRFILDLAAASFVASVSDRPSWPESDAGARRLGYLRNGAVVSAYDPPIRNDDCKEGWYELASGGFVCGKVATIDLQNPRVKLAPKQPDLDAGMPYRYGANVADGTPVYRRVLNAQDRRRYEPHLAPKVEEASEEVAANATTLEDTPSGGGERGPSEVRSEVREEVRSDVREEVKAAVGEKPTSSEEEKQEGEPEGARRDDDRPLGDKLPPKSEAPARAAEEPSRKKGDKKDKGSKRSKRDKRDREPPKDPFQADAGRPQLKELKGRGVLVRRMARGFTVALDRDFKAAGTRWWRTTLGFAVPYDRIVVQNGAAKHLGNWFTGEAVVADVLPFPELSVDGVAEPNEGALEIAPDAGAPLAGTVAFVMISGAHKIEVGVDAKGAPKAAWAGELPKRSAVLLTGREVKISGVTYHQTSAGFWVRLAELRIAQPQIPDDVGVDERWIDVDLTRQQLVAFEGRRPVFATLISSGRRNPYDPERDFSTPPGVFRIREKHVTATMDGDVASDGPYSIEDVPWVMYYQGSYAIHGAFWHNLFGNTRSHGCVNMSPEDARALFNWAEPTLPAGWHGVFSKDENSGSRVVVHEDPKPKPKRRVTSPSL